MWWLYAVAVAFVVFAGGMVVASLLRPEPPTYPPTPSDAPPPAGSLVPDRRITIDARDPERWIFFDFSSGRVVERPGPDGWDIAVRRFHLIVNGGSGFPGDAGALDLGEIPFEAVDGLPAGEYAGSRGSLEGEARHPVLSGWYRYSFLSHLLWPRPRTYAIRTAEGGYAKIRILSYYCPGARPGCLTIRYGWRGDGGRSFPPAGERPERPRTGESGGVTSSADGS